MSLLLCAAASAAAGPEVHVPRSLRMRSPRPQVAQAPAPDPVPDDQANPLPEPDPAASSAAGAAPSPPAATPQVQAPNLTDEELAKLAAEEDSPGLWGYTRSPEQSRATLSTSPVFIIDREMLAGAGVVNLGEILQRLPAQGNAINARVTQGGDGATRIALRSLGAQRTLVLVNGRRMVPIGIGADSVDLAAIPLEMVDAVEIQKSPAPGNHGSDAIAGVINIFTREKMDGTDAAAYIATSQKRDGTTYDLSLVTSQYSRRGTVTVFAGYQLEQPVMATDRDFAASTSTYHYACSAAALAAGTCKPGETTLRDSAASATGFLNTLGGPGGEKAFAPMGCSADICTADLAHPGQFRNVVPPTATELGDAYNTESLSYLVTPSTHLSLFATGNYHFGLRRRAYFEASFGSRTSSQRTAPLALLTSQTGTRGIAISKDSLYNPFGVDITDYRRQLTEIGPHTTSQEVATSRIVVGLEGFVDEDTPVVRNWKWDVSYDYGRSKSTNTVQGDLVVSRLQRALGPSFDDPVRGPTCGTPASPIADCVPLGILTPGQVSPEAIKYLTFKGLESSLGEQHTGHAKAHGRLVELPHGGDVTLMVGGDYRFDRDVTTPDPLTAIGDTTGGMIAPGGGSYGALEGFGEVSVVPASGRPYLDWLELDAEARAHHDDRFGSAGNWKLSGLARNVRWFAVRSSYAAARRTPSIRELSAGQADRFVLLPDPCDTANRTMPTEGQIATQCAKQGVPESFRFSVPQLRTRLGGNAALRPETAAVATAGIVYDPTQRFAVTLDYWHIRIDDAIETLSPATIVAQCYQGGIAEFCHQIERDPATHVIRGVLDHPRNVAAVTTSGLDFTAVFQYRNDLGIFRHAIEGTYLFKYNIDTGTVNPTTNKPQILHGRGFYDLGAHPDLKLNLSTSWSSSSGSTAGVSVRFVDSFQECDHNNCNDRTNLRRDVSKHLDADLFATYVLRTDMGQTSISAGVNNLADARPPTIYNGAALNADESAYDFLGRQFYVRLGQRF